MLRKHCPLVLVALLTGFGPVSRAQEATTVFLDFRIGISSLKKSLGSDLESYESQVSSTIAELCDSFGSKRTAADGKTTVKKFFPWVFRPATKDEDLPRITLTLTERGQRSKPWYVAIALTHEDGSTEKISEFIAREPGEFEVAVTVPALNDFAGVVNDAFERQYVNRDRYLQFVEYLKQLSIGSAEILSDARNPANPGALHGAILVDYNKYEHYSNSDFRIATRHVEMAERGYINIETQGINRSQKVAAKPFPAIAIQLATWADGRPITYSDRAQFRKLQSPAATCLFMKYRMETRSSLPVAK